MAATTRTESLGINTTDDREPTQKLVRTDSVAQFKSVPQSGTHLGNGWKITGRLIWILMRVGRRRKEVKTQEENIYKIKD